VFPVNEVAGMQMEGMFIGACNTTEEELILAALVLRRAMEDGKSPRGSSNRLVVPGSLEIAGHLRAKGLLEVFERAGFRVGPPGCSMCLGIASDKAGPGENWLTSQNRNFENRMGPGSIAWLASAPTVAASALDLTITDPRALLARIPEDEFQSYLPGAKTRPAVTVREPATDLREGEIRTASGGAPSTNGAEILEGRVQRFGDHVDTDAMIPGEFCHLTDPAQIGKVAFHYVRPDFGERLARGETILVAGEGWGSGSSREHAVWALKYAGVKAIIAKSFAFIHKRNLVNEAVPFFTVTDPEFYVHARDGAPIAIRAHDGVIALDGREFKSEPVSEIAHMIQTAGGIVPAVEKHGRETFDVLTAGAAVG
jgi:aconitate hydratase/homoaconitate hydratase